MSFRKSSFLQDPMEASGSFTGSFAGDASGITGVETASYVLGSDVDGAVVQADSASLAGAISGSNVAGAVVQADSASLAAAISGSNVAGTVDSASLAAAISGSDVAGAVVQADSASLAAAISGSDVAGTVGSASFASTSSFANSPLFTAPRPIKTIGGTNPYIVLSSDHTVLIDATSGTAAIDVTLPDTADFIFGTNAKVLTVIKSAGANNVQVLASGSQKIVGDATSTLTDLYQGLTLQPSGPTWWVI